MRRVVILALLAMVVPMAAWADTITVDNQWGNLSLSLSGLKSTNSELMDFNEIAAAKGRSLGHLNFGTGAFSGASLKSDGTFSATGSWFDIWGNGTYGMHKGEIFQGSFVGPISWTVTSTGKANLTFALTGDIAGTLYTGQKVTGTTTQYLYSTNGQLKLGIGHIKMGSTTLSTSPEPGTLGLLGTGLVGIAGLFRKKAA